MRRYLLAAVSVLVVSNSLAAQESLWSGTMTAGKDEINGNRVVGYNRSPAAPVMGELSDAEFDFRGITYRGPPPAKGVAYGRSTFEGQGRSCLA